MDDKMIKEFEQYIKDEMDEEAVPANLEPENMKERLEKADIIKRRRKFKGISMAAAAAACVVVLISVGIHTKNMIKENEIIESAETNEEVEIVVDGDNTDTYKQIYRIIKENREDEYYDYYDTETYVDVVVEESAIKSTGSAANSNESANASEFLWGGRDDSFESLKGDYADTNVQVEFVDEGDIVKNDGRYLYQLLRDEDYQYSQIQLIDTKEGLEEVSRIDGFENISEFYIYDNTVVVIESLWAEYGNEEGKNAVSEELHIDYSYRGSNEYSKIYFYDISDKENPKEIHNFTIKGSFKTSRVSDGYLYFFSKYYTSDPENEDDLEAYIPVINGELLSEESLYVPEETDEASYLIMVAVNLSEPTKFTDVMAAVSAGNYYYVSEKNIYVLDIKEMEEKEGIQCDSTRILKFSYEMGQIEPFAEGVVDGSILDQFAMDEHEGYFRMITTVNPYELEEVVDDITGKSIGMSYNSISESNSVYVLDENLKITGSIEDLAENEMVYSARFMGDTGYFVTFRQVDPLFSVDFSDPSNPEIIGELKISGFSEYLHFYGDDLLLGIGYEADEDTGRTEGIKISMFDISDPSNVKEINKLVFEEYDSSDALYNHHAVLVNADKNIIGFLADGYGYEHIRDYNVYSYNFDEGFSLKFKIDCVEDNDEYNETRGTYIGDTFYLLMQNGGVKAYNINSGEMIEELKTE